MPVDPPNRSGCVSFVGAGPGAADLITVRGAEALRGAEVVVHDLLVPTALLDAFCPTAERLPVARDDRGQGDPGAVTGRLLVTLALAGRRVVRLKGGDPTVFARLAEEMQPLHDAGVPVAIVPGVTAALAAAAAAVLPLTNRSTASSVTILTGHEADDKLAALDFQALAALPGTLVVYMGVEQAARWARSLIGAGKAADTPVTIVSRCSWPDERVATGSLADCAAGFDRAGWQSPAVVIVGAACGPAAGPLAGRRVLLTRPAGQGDELAGLVRAVGGQCLAVPVIGIDDPPSWQPLDAAIARADTYDWLVFASVNGVRSFVGRLRAVGRDARALGTVRLAAIGPATRRALEDAGLACDLQPTAFRSEGLADAFASLPAGGRFLLLRADKGRDALRRALEDRGHHVDEVVAYVSRPVAAVDAATLAALDAGIDWVTVTSSSIAASAVRLFGERMRRWRIASISPVTSAALERAGLRATVEAEDATAAGLVAAMSRWEGAAARPAESSQSG
jgi:uroporphyrinogen III methyltransferase/synthase